MESTRRQFLNGSMLALGAAVLPLSGVELVHASVNKTGVQMAGVHRMKLGEFEVTALLDGYLDIVPAMLPQSSPEEAVKILSESFLPTDKIRMAVSCFAVNTGKKMVLIDTGAGNLMGPTVSNTAKNLEAAGISPNSIDEILLSHLHPDHIGGMLNAKGEVVFKNAQVITHQKEVGFWTSEEMFAKAPKEGKGAFMAARAVTKAYDGRIKTFSKETEVTSGISSVFMPGHTPGHSGYMISSGDKQLLMWADTVLASPLQFAHPEWAIIFDIDQEGAIKSRKRVLDMTTSDKLLVAGSHLPFPGFGHVTKAKQGYHYVPADWQYKL